MAACLCIHLALFVSSDWRCADEASRAGVIAVKPEAAGGADRQRPWCLLSDLCWAKGGKGGCKTNQLQLCWICRDLVKEGWSLKEAVWGNEGCGLCKPLRKYYWMQQPGIGELLGPVLRWADSKLQWEQIRKERVAAVLCGQLHDHHFGGKSMPLIAHVFFVFVGHMTYLFEIKWKE